MPFECPRCSQIDSLAIVESIELPSDVRSDDIALQILECEACGFRGLAVYEESRRGALESEAWEHTGYWASKALVASVHAAILCCPDPVHSDCQCPSHRKFGQVDDQGRWQIPEGIRGEISFPMRLSASRT